MPNLPVSDSLKKTILNTIGLSEGDPNADYFVAKILDDHEVLDVAMRAACRAFAPDALRMMDGDQIFRLKKRIQPPAGPAVKFGLVEATRSGFVMIRAWLENPSASNRDHAVLVEEFFDGPPESLLEWTFRGQRCPRACAERYASLYEPHFSAAVSLPIGRTKAERDDENTSRQILEKQQEQQRPRYVVSPQLFEALGKTPAELADEEASKATLARQRNSA